MSRWNGDKSRFNRERKQGIHRRIRNRELLEAATAAVAAKSKPVAIVAAASSSGTTESRA